MEKFGLVLEGGGAKGAYEIGACKALDDLNVKFSAVTGTSVGALNGAMVAQHDLEKAWHLWENIHPSQVMNIDENKLSQLTRLEIKPGDMRYYIKIFGEIIAEGGVDVTPLKHLIQRYVNERKLRTSDTDFGMVTVSFSDRKALELFVSDIPFGQVADYLFASANFPLFRSAKIGDKIYLDGGIYDSLPIRMLTARGYTSLITIRVNGMGIKRKVNLENCHVINIEAREPLGGPLHFNAKNSQKNLKLGYYDAFRAMKALAGHYYYIDLEHPDEYFFDYFSHLKPEIIKKIGKVMAIKSEIPPKRMLFEKILPRLIELFKLPEKSGYGDIAVAIAEKMAIELNVERFKIYHFDQLVNQIIQNYYKKSSNKKEKGLNLISHLGFLSLFSGDLMLKKLVKQLLNDDIIKALKWDRKSESSFGSTP